MLKSTKNSKATKNSKNEMAAEAAVKKSSGGWEPSTFRTTDLATLVRGGVLMEGSVRIPGEEEMPQPNPDERVCFESFVR